MMIRRDVPAYRTPRGGRPPNWRLDRRLGGVLVVLGLLAAVVASGVAAPAAPRRIEDTSLAGDRSLPGRACVVIAGDLSGSMDQVAAQRQEAVAALFPWLKRNLHGDDVVVMVNFTDQAALVLPATPISALPTTAPPDSPVGGGGTLLVPAVDLAQRALSGSGCGAIALLAISDGAFGDTPAAIASSLQEAQITRSQVLNPNGPARVDPLNDPSLLGVRVRGITDRDEMSVAFGEAIADLTGQRLQSR